MKSATGDSGNEETEKEMEAAVTVVTGSSAEIVTGAAMILCTIEYKLTPVGLHLMLLTAI